LTPKSFSCATLHFSSENRDFDDAWFNTFQTFSSMHVEKYTQMEAIIRRIIPEKFFFAVKEDNQDVGVALGVFERGYLGVYSLLVDPMKRRRSTGYSLMRYIEEWGINNSVHTIYLQVEHDNLAASKMYQKLGYRNLYSYHYRIKCKRV
jgi:ribosomal protein S18 acetylase RimI-like enzyme